MIYANIFIFQLQIQTNTFKIITNVMRTHFSDSNLPQSKHLKIDTQRLQSIPPGCQKQSILGLFTLRISTNYLNTMRQSTFLRCKLWGMQESILLEELSQNERIVNLNIRSNIQNITKYFQDLKIIYIEVFTGLKKDREGFTENKKAQTDFKQIGLILVNPQRYVINHVINDFEETMNIIDMRKQKIGQALVKFHIQMYKKEQLFINPSEPQIIQPTSLNEIPFPALSQNKKLYQKIVPIREPNTEFMRENHIDLSNSQEQSEKRPMKEDDFLPEFKKKSRAQMFLQEYNKNKPPHSELSLLRDKYGFNHPSVQVMKLKYDQVKLLSSFRKEGEVPREARVNILLKTLKNETKNKIQYLNIYCEESKSKIKVQTKIALPQQVNQKIDINHLYMIPSSSSDLLTFEIKEGKTQIEVQKLKSLSRVELRNRNGKKVAILELVPLSSKDIEQSAKNKDFENSKNEIIKPISPQTQVKQPKKQKENGYICVLHWPSDKISLKNKHFGITSACKLLFELSDPSQNIIQVILQNDKKQANYLEVQLRNLFQEQNYQIQGHQVKVISCRGHVQEILDLLNKLEPDKPEMPLETIQKKQVRQCQQNIRNCVVIFGKFSKSQEVECNELIEQMTTLDQVNFVKIQKLSKMIDVDPNLFLIVLKEQFNSKFSDFFTMFQVYHRWNHKYMQSLRKLHRLIEPLGRDFFRLVNKLKKSNELLFGALPSNVLVNQFVKLDEQEVDFDHQSLGRLFALLFERYFNKSIKISEIQQFIQNKPEVFDLNFYLLSKISNQIKNEPQIFQDILTQNQNKFIRLFSNQKQFTGELGLAKLLLTSEEEDLTESSVLSQFQPDNRRETERADPIVTEQSRQPIQQGQQRRLTSKQTQEEGLPKEKNSQKIPVVLSSLYLKTLQQIEVITIFNENQSMRLEKQAIALPKAIILEENAIYTLTVQTAKNVYQGVFVALKTTQNKKLYNEHSQESGYFSFFDDRKTQTEQSEIPFRLVTTQKALQMKQFIRNPKKLENDSSLLNKDLPKAMSPQVKLTVRSISPTQPKFQFKITSRDPQTKLFLQYPTQNELLVSNNLEGWILNLLNQDFEEILIPNIIGSNTYCLINSSDKQVAYMIIIEVAESWNSQFVRSPKESIHIFCHFDQLINLKSLKPSTYTFVLQNDQKITELTQIEANSQKRLVIGVSCQLDSIGDYYEVKIINKQTKELLAQFEFTVKMIQGKVQKSERYLVSKHDGFRLKITVFQLRHEWIHYKPDKFLPLFSSTTNKRTLSSYFSSITVLDEQIFILWLRNNFELTLAEIDILLTSLLNNEKGNSWKSFMKLFEIRSYPSLEKQREVQQEFKTFDLNEEGTISYQQMPFIKRTLQKNFRQTFQLFNQLECLFKTSSEQDQNFIIDLSVPRQRVFDYLSFLAQIRDPLNDPTKPKKHISKEEHKQESLYLKIGILSFSKLSINGAPSTLLFKIKGQRLADPVHRCFSYIYKDPAFITIENDKRLFLEIFCQRLNLDGQWEYKLVQKVSLSEEIKILGGTIFLKIEQVNQKKDQKRINYLKQRQQQIDFQASQIKHKNLQVQQIPEKDDRMQRSDFEKSFWNKSLNETRQKWTNMAATGKKDKRKLLNLKSQQIQKKMNIFDQFYEK